MSFINTTLDSKRKHGMVTVTDTLRLGFDTEIKENEQEYAKNYTQITRRI
jgi:hypothetical protein